MGDLLTDFSGTVAGFDDTQYFIFLAFFGVVSAVAFVRAFRTLRLTRLVEDLPTSRTRSAPQGYIELAGIARLMPGPQIVTPMSQRPCVWWSLVTEEYKSDQWQAVEREVSDELFHLNDDSGTCIVDPENADVSAGHKLVTKTGSLLERSRSTRFRHTERYIKDGDELHIIGWHRTFKSDANWDHQEELVEKLREWKRDQETLVRRFDANRDGRIDEQEWETARREARKEVAAEHREASVAPGVNVIGAPDDARPFLIAAEHEDLVARRLWRSTIITAVVCVVAGFLTILTIAARL
ncbi:MAG: hypothetical protein AB8G16_05985 [Gammaproteobacteria bacterium]